MVIIKKIKTMKITMEKMRKEINDLKTENTELKKKMHSIILNVDKKEVLVLPMLLVIPSLIIAIPFMSSAILIISSMIPSLIPSLIVYKFISS